MIINSQLGGITPTGTKSITANGVYDVTDFASADVQVPTTAPDFYGSFELLQTQRGKLVNKRLLADFSSIDGASSGYVFAYMYYGCSSSNSNVVGAIDLSNIKSLTNGSICLSMFEECDSITSVDLSGLERVYGNSVMKRMFYNAKGLVSIDLSSFSIISGSGNVMEQMFYGCSSLEELVMDSLSTNNCYYGFIWSNVCFDCTRLRKFSAKKLSGVNHSYCFSNAFNNCTSLTNVDLRSYDIAGQYCFYYAFSGCTSLVSQKFESVNTAGYGSFESAFSSCSSLTTVSFYALNSNSFSVYTDQFKRMLANCSNVTVHFPMRIQSTIGSWTDVTAGFNGTNTTVLFDIVTSLTGDDTNTYSRQEKDSTGTAIAWVLNDVLYYTSGTTEPVVGDTIYSDAACTTAVTTISTIA